MRPLVLLITLLLAAALAYYIYVPLPDSVQEPWKLMFLDAVIRTIMHVVRSRLGVKLNGTVKFVLVCAGSSRVSAKEESLQ